MPQLQFFDRVVVQLLHRDRYTVQTVQKTVVIAQVQFLGRLGYPSLYNDRCFGLQSRKLWKFRSCSALTGWSMFPLQFIDKVWTFPCPVGGASDSVHCMCWIMMAVMGFLAHFAPFFALLRLSGVERQFSVGEPSMMKSSSSSRAGR